MTIAESRRLALYESVKTFLGEDNAQTLMASLPPDPDTFATKADLALLGAELRGEMKVLGADLSAQIARETRSLALAMIGMVLTVLTIALGAVALA